ncbi:MAG: arylsulfatase [Phycisphaerales bacterium]|nr:arylsulfatase [Phycisphaerales bacterium]
MLKFFASTLSSHAALAPHFTARPASIPMHENACKCTVLAKREFSPPHLNTRQSAPPRTKARQRAPSPANSISAKRTHPPKWQSLLLLSLLSLLFLLPQRAPAQNEPTKPNLILILCDDLGYGDLASYGNTTIKSPNLDRLATEGIRFTDFYAAGIQCTPSRAGLLTGRYPVRFRLTYSLMTNTPTGIPDSETLLPQLLQKQGYATMLAGKWHLGDQPQHHPLKHGFDHFQGLLRGHDTDPREFWNDNRIIEKQAPIETLTQRYTTAATDFIAAQSRKKQPFFLMLAHTAPHTPLTTTYAQAVEEIDASIGQLRAALKQANLEDNTLIFFSSDNGPAVGKEGGVTGPLRAGKFSTYEGGIRVPAIAWFPAKFKPRIESRPAILLDLFPTFLNIAGAKPQTTKPIDGKDLTPLLFENKPREGADFFFYAQDRLEAHRSANWKLKLPDRQTAPPELYDLEKDPAESKDVAKEHPDIVKRLQQQMADEQKALTSQGG